MKITLEEIHALAMDARLKITHEEMPNIIQYMNNFLTEMERMSELEFKDAALFDFADASCPLREDDILEYPYRDDILSAAPNRAGDYYRVARILEE
jgi:aspartyl/glutamyl-tRNA(Asn/Gln) amidotransferase C subunit